MAGISSYSTLATALQDYLARSNVGVASGNIDYFIQETEQEMNARLRVRRMLTSVTPTVSAAGVVTLPSDFGGWKRFQVRQSGVEWDLALKSAEETTQVSDLYTSSGTPRALITNGATSQIWPFTVSLFTYAGLYYARIPALTASATTNWVVTNFPTAYLSGCLAAAYRYMQDLPDAMSHAASWDARFGKVIEQIKAEDSRDLDARSVTVLTPDTTMFGGSKLHNIQSDGQ